MKDKRHIRFTSNGVKTYTSKQVLGVKCAFVDHASQHGNIVYESADQKIHLTEWAKGVTLRVSIFTEENNERSGGWGQFTDIYGKCHTRCDTELKLAEKDLLRNLRVTIKDATKIIERSKRRSKPKPSKVSRTFWNKAKLLDRFPSIKFHVLKHEIASVKVPGAGGSKYHFVASSGPDSVTSGHKSNDTVYPLEFEVKLSRDHRTALDEILALEQRLYDKYKGRGTHMFWRPLTATRCLLSYVIL